MLVYVIKEKQLLSYPLPSKVYGSYFIDDVDEQGEVTHLISIKEQEGKWVAISNKEVKIVSGKQTLSSLVLEDYQFIFLQVKDRIGYVMLYVCPLNDKTMIKVKIPEDAALTIGHDQTNSIVCHHSLISPIHVRLTCQKGTWILEDLDSKYGTFVNNKRVAKLQRLYPGDVIFIMGFKMILLNGICYFNNPLQSVTYDSKLLVSMAVEKVPELKEPLISEETITLYQQEDYFVRSPRFMEVVEEREFHLEAPPNLGQQEETPLILTMGPMLTMGMTSFVMVFVSLLSLQNGGTLISVLPMMAMSVSMLAGTLLWPAINRSFSKKQRQKKQEQRDRRYNEYLEQKEKELTQLAAMQKQVLLSNYLSSLECYQLIVNRSRHLWTRELHQNDFLTLRLGLGPVPLAVKIDYPGERFSLEDDLLEQKMRLIVDNHQEVAGVPIITSLIEKNILALEGKYAFIKPYMDSLLIQIMALHSYYDLKIVILTNERNAPYWEYLKLLPHLWSDDREIRFFSTNYDEGKEISQYLQKIILLRQELSRKGQVKADFYKNLSCYYLIITDDFKATRDFSIVEEVLSSPLNLGFSLLIMHPNLANLPTECKAFIGLDREEEGVIFENELTANSQRKFQIETKTQQDLNFCTLKLANIPIENKNESYHLPKVLGFLEMYGVGLIEQLNPVERWKMNDPINSLSVAVGLLSNGNLFKLDLHEKEQGPHGLIAGMTGSGKSEFIITYILSMAINYHPDEVQFVLIDYKGGGLVGAFENKETGVRLPHLAGTITNLDIADIHRALASIESELKRRQRLFNQARDQLGEGTIDIYKYQRYYREGALSTPVAHLFIISDEFAELKSQQPEFMDQLISTARIGRSLGVHLILATQKPSGVVNDQIWSNSRFRVCFKVQEAADSNEMIKRSDAAALKEVGRFYLQVGYNELFALGQAAWAGSKYIPQEKVYHEEDDRIIFINAIGKSIKTISTPRKEMIKDVGEELPNIVKYLDAISKKEHLVVRPLWLEKLAAFITVDSLKEKYNYVKKPFHVQAIVGEYDQPKEQKQELLLLDLVEKGNAVIYSMANKNSLVNALVYSLVTTYTVEEVNLYLLDLDTETLKIYDQMPQVGDVVFVNETEKVEKLFKFLNEEVNHRKKLFQNYNGSYQFYNTNSSEKLPAIVFILTGYENFKESYETLDPVFIKLTRDCAKYGIYCILTAISDRALRLSVRSNFPQILPLKLSAPIEYNMLLGKKAPLIADIEGRGVALVVDEPYEFQSAVVCQSDQLHQKIIDLTKKLKEYMPHKKAPRIPVLPEVVTLSMLLQEEVSLHQVAIGIFEDSLTIAKFDFAKYFMSMINAEDLGALENFSYLLLKEIALTKIAPLVVVNLASFYRDREPLSTIRYLENKDSILEDLKYLLSITEDTFVFVTGFDQLLSSLTPSDKPNFINFLATLKLAGKCHFVIVSRLADLKAFAYEAWFKQYISTDSGIYLGRGLNNSTIHNLVTPLRQLAFPLPSNFGYYICQGEAIRIKVVEKGGDIDGE